MAGRSEHYGSAAVHDRWSTAVGYWFWDFVISMIWINKRRVLGLRRNGIDIALEYEDCVLANVFKGM